MVKYGFTSEDVYSRLSSDVWMRGEDVICVLERDFNVSTGHRKLRVFEILRQLYYEGDIERRSVDKEFGLAYRLGLVTYEYRLFSKL